MLFVIILSLNDVQKEGSKNIKGSKIQNFTKSQKQFEKSVDFIIALPLYKWMARVQIHKGKHSVP